MNERVRVEAIKEHEEWKKLVALLRAQGCVRESDLHASRADLSTKGRRLFSALKDWGASCRMLGAAQMQESTQPHKPH